MLLAYNNIVVKLAPDNMRKDSCSSRIYMLIDSITLFYHLPVLRVPAVVVSIGMTNTLAVLISN